jgi:hypothetical protein
MYSSSLEVKYGISYETNKENKYDINSTAIPQLLKVMLSQTTCEVCLKLVFLISSAEPISYWNSMKPFNPLIRLSLLM